MINRRHRNGPRTAAPSPYLIAAGAVAATGLAALAPTAARAQAAPAVPVVSYAPEGDRQIIFVNNPERLELGFTDLIPGSTTFGVTYQDLADPALGNKLIQKLTVGPGSYRNIFEHTWNAARATSPAAAQNPINYGVYVSNPNASAITVTLRGKGFRTGFDGGRPIADMLNAEAANAAGTAYVLEPNQTLWLLRSDIDYNFTRPISPGTFFSGAVDFDVSGGQAVVANLAYQVYGSLTRPANDDEKANGKGEHNGGNADESKGNGNQNDNNGNGNGQDDGTPGGPGDSNGSGNGPDAVINTNHLNDPQDMGYLWRRYTPTAAPESRVYKGLMLYHNQAASGSGVATNLSFTVSDATPAGDLRVQYPRYLNNSNGTLNFYAPSTTVINTPYWFTHNVPIRDTATIQVVSNDMFDIFTPGYGRLYALYQTNSPNTPFGQANFGNWGVIYREAITITNTGTRGRVVSLRLNNQTNGNSPIAYKDAAGVWQSAIVRAAPFTYRTATVPAGATVTVEGNFTLGCPGVGTLKHIVNVQ